MAGGPGAYFGTDEPEMGGVDEMPPGASGTPPIDDAMMLDTLTQWLEAKGLDPAQAETMPLGEVMAMMQPAEPEAVPPPTGDMGDEPFVGDEEASITFSPDNPGRPRY